jgi:transcriptional regulator with XRE-family HTH domain
MSHLPNTQTFARPFPNSFEIGARLRSARKARGWTIQEMSEIGEIKAVVIGSYERGSRNMPLSRLGELARILNVSVEYLLGIETTREAISHAIVIDLRSLSKPNLDNPDWLFLLINYTSRIAKERSDWNGELLSLRASDLTTLAYTIGIDERTFLNWLIAEQYLFKGSNHL